MVDLSGADERHLRRAIALAATARAAGEQPFGSLLVLADEVLLEEHNTAIADADLAAHPEMKLARWAGRELTPEQSGAATMYTSCEPCGMCAGAIARSGIGRVVFALSAEQLGALKPAGSPAPDDRPIEFVGPALHAEAAVPIAGFYD